MSEQVIEWAVSVSIGMAIINLLIFALSLKLYTEYVKDKLQDKRKQP